MTQKQPAIHLRESFCQQWGECWCADPPYYTGHYRRKDQAAVAATKRKRELAAQGGVVGELETTPKK